MVYSRDYGSFLANDGPYSIETGDPLQMITESDFRRFLNFNDIEYKEINDKTGEVTFLFNVDINPLERRRIGVEFSDDRSNIHIDVGGFKMYFSPEESYDKFAEIINRKDIDKEVEGSGFEEFAKFIRSINFDESMIYQFNITFYDEAYVFANIDNDSTLTLDSFLDTLKLGLKQIGIIDHLYQQV